MVGPIDVKRKGECTDWKLGQLCAFNLILILGFFKVKFWNSDISGFAGVIYMKCKGRKCIVYWADYMTFDHTNDIRVWNSLISGLGGLIDAEHKRCEWPCPWLLDDHRNIDRHTAHIIVSWPNPKQWVIVHTSDLIMIIRQSMYILSIITKEMGELKTHSPTYCMMDNWENMLNLTHTLDKLYLTGIL